jgi:hypothetical protein
MKQQTKTWLWTGCFLLALGVFALAYMAVDHDKEQFMEKSKALEQQLHSRDADYDEAMNSLFTIEEQIREIKRREKLISTISQSDFGSDFKSNITEDIKAIDSLIRHSNQTITQLYSRLEKASIDVKFLKSRLNELSSELENERLAHQGLQAELTKKEVKINELQYAAQEMEDKISTQELTIATQAKTIDQKDDDLNRGYMAINTKQALEEKGVVEQEGGFLWFGKTLKLNEQANQEMFTELDIRVHSSFYIDAKSIEFVTRHPADSYQIIQEDKKIKGLIITDPERFWQMSKYLVVAIQV